MIVRRKKSKVRDISKLPKDEQQRILRKREYDNQFHKERRRREKIAEAIKADPKMARRALFKHSFGDFVQYFWDTIIMDDVIFNWHMDYLCKEAQKIVMRVVNRQPNDGDLVINVPPGTSKSTIFSQMLPAWAWAYWPWLRFLTGSYSSHLSLEHADRSRQIVRSAKYRELYPHIGIRADKDAKTNFQIEVRSFDEEGALIDTKPAGSRFTTSTGGSITGFHGDILIVDDPLDPKQAASAKTLEIANDWMSYTLPSRVVNKEVSTIILVMQRLHQADPAGNRIAGQEDLPIRHICLPAELDHKTGGEVIPPELTANYVDGLLDPVRMKLNTLKRQNYMMGDRQYACQYQQNPKAGGAAIFQVENLKIMENMPHPNEIVRMVRFWDIAASEHASADYSVGVLMAYLRNKSYLILDVKRERKATEERNRWMRSTAMSDGIGTKIKFEQQPGAAGKDSALGIVQALAGFSVTHALATGNKVDRADPFASQVNAGNVYMLLGPWNATYKSELEWFPNSKHDDQVDASSGAFNEIAQGKTVKVF